MFRIALHFVRCGECVRDAALSVVNTVLKLHLKMEENRTSYCACSPKKARPGSDTNTSPRRALRQQTESTCNKTGATLGVVCNHHPNSKGSESLSVPSSPNMENFRLKMDAIQPKTSSPGLSRKHSFRYSSNSFYAKRLVLRKSVHSKLGKFARSIGRGAKTKQAAQQTTTPSAVRLLTTVDVDMLLDCLHSVSKPDSSSEDSSSDNAPSSTGSRSEENGPTQVKQAQRLAARALLTIASLPSTRRALMRPEYLWKLLSVLEPSCDQVRFVLSFIEKLTKRFATKNM